MNSLSLEGADLDIDQVKRAYSFAESFMSRVEPQPRGNKLLRAYVLLGDLYDRGFTLRENRLQGKDVYFPAFEQVSFLNIQKLTLVEYLEAVLSLEERSEKVRRIASVGVACFASRVFARAEGFTFQEKIEERVKRQLSALFEEGCQVSRDETTIGNRKSWPVFVKKKPSRLPESVVIK